MLVIVSLFSIIALVLLVYKRPRGFYDTLHSIHGATHVTQAPVATQESDRWSPDAATEGGPLHNNNTSTQQVIMPLNVVPKTAHHPIDHRPNKSYVDGDPSAVGMPCSHTPNPIELASKGGTVPEGMAGTGTEASHGPLLSEPLDDGASWGFTPWQMSLHDL